MLILVPFFVSFVISGPSRWNFILGSNGLIFGPLKSLGFVPQDFTILRTPVAIIAGITYNFMPFAALPLYVSLSGSDHRLVEAAKDLYASKATAFRKVVLPLRSPGIFAAIIWCSCPRPATT